MMGSKLMILSLILFSVACSSIAQLALKMGMSNPVITQILDKGEWKQIAFAIGLNPWVISGLSLYFFGALIWLLVLARVELSFAYPFVGLGFIMTMLLGRFVLGDDLSLQRILGTLIIVTGVLLIASE